MLISNKLQQVDIVSFVLQLQMNKSHRSQNENLNTFHEFRSTILRTIVSSVSSKNYLCLLFLWVPMISVFIVYFSHYFNDRIGSVAINT